MRLERLIKKLDGCRPGLKASAGWQIKGITCDSRKVLPGFIFFAFRGQNSDGREFIPQALGKGARVVISDPLGLSRRRMLQERHKNSVFMEVPDARLACAVLAGEFYAHPSHKLRVVGITGTNGKTTATYLIESLLGAVNINSAVIGTINHRIKNKTMVSSNTTPGPVELQAILAEAVAQGCGYALMEVSSHALKQNRVAGVRFHSAIFTNLTHDHLDYHSNMGDYFAAKARLFRSLDLGFSIINNDDPYGRRLIKLAGAKAITYGLTDGVDFSAQDINATFRRTEFTLVGAGLKLRIKSRLIGRHNIYNILAALAWAAKQGLPLSAAAAGISKLKNIPGRMERIDSGRGYTVFVDYAHTEDALRNALESLRQLCPAKVIVVFGCGGDRDKAKRPKMGRVVSELADYAIITSDNPRSEDPAAIIRDIKSGLRKRNWCVIPDRKEAIRKSLTLAQKGDIIFVAGKGHERCQIIGKRVFPFDDRKVVRQCLGLMN